jgi:septal ring-binding cell division protein DamX
MKILRALALLLLILLIALVLACTPGPNNGSVALQSAATPRSTANPATTSDDGTRTAVVTATKANVRDQPSRKGAVLKEVRKSDHLILIKPGSSGPWYNVRERQSGTAGWIHGDAIEFEQPNIQATASEQPVEPLSPSSPSVPNTSGRSYINVDGTRVPSPVFTRRRPSGATARCGDGSYSFSQHSRGTCSHHGGVAEWL